VYRVTHGDNTKLIPNVCRENWRGSRCVISVKH